MLVYRDQAVSTLSLPRHALGHVFDEEAFPVVRLPHLTELVIDGLSKYAMQQLHTLRDTESESDSESESCWFDSSDDSEQSEEGGGEQHDPYWAHWCVDSVNLKDVAKACPKLRRLTLNSVLAADADEVVAVHIPRALRKLQVCWLACVCLSGRLLLGGVGCKASQMHTAFNASCSRSLGHCAHSPMTDPARTLFFLWL